MRDLLMVKEFAFVGTERNIWGSSSIGFVIGIDVKISNTKLFDEMGYIFFLAIGIL